MFKPTNLHLNFHIVVADSAVKVFLELVKCVKFRPGCWQNATYVPDTSDRSRTHGADCESHHHISPKQKQNNKKGDIGSGK